MKKERRRRRRIDRCHGMRQRRPNLAFLIGRFIKNAARRIVVTNDMSLKNKLFFCSTFHQSKLNFILEYYTCCHNSETFYIVVSIKSWKSIDCELGIPTQGAGFKGQTNPLIYGGTLKNIIQQRHGVTAILDISAAGYLTIERTVVWHKTGRNQTQSKF